jgi:hypothetical protein
MVMNKNEILTVEYLTELGAKHDIGKVYVLDNYKIIVLDDGFVFLLGSSMFSSRVTGKTIQDFNKIREAVGNYA